ncbi:MAG: right-handed parallel beta-helix repeat-containing protein [Deltaproteobacteria bacterium]|nr:right-handed parallel beta-helix repeat-containing protein [Deltaproteobacteria bacterium]
MRRLAAPLCVCLVSLLTAAPARAADYTAGPSDYTSIVPTLAAGDTLTLEAGTYTDLLNITDLNGTASEWITITGPASGDPAVFVADPGPCCNTVEIRNSSYVAIRSITVDGDMVDGAFGLSAGGGTSNLVHHITVEDCSFMGHDAGQQTVAISTKTPTWGWTIRGNRIVGAGTGMYLGNSDGTSPFLASVVEYNLVMDTMGYNVQIKWQQPRPDVAGMPTGPSSTIIRHNVFIKNDRASPSGDRPNLLVGGFPASGAGSEDIYEIYGNFFFHNPRESLLQASGRVTIHDNVFVDVTATAVTLQDHDLPLRLARVYNNTIYSAGRGISVSGTLDQGAWAVGNLIFSSTPVSGTWTEERDNMSDAVDQAHLYVSTPSLVLGEMDFYPLPGQCQGPALDLSAFSSDAEYDRDFNSTSKGGITFRGAYAGEGENPGWQLDAGNKGEAAVVPPDEEPDGSSPDAAADAPPDGPVEPGPDAADDGSTDGPEGDVDSGGASGCGCRLIL